MMDLLLATSGGESQSASGGYVDDVFSAYTYTGNGATQTINNGIDLAGNGGLVWIKSRSGAFNHGLIDTVRGRGSELHSNTAIGADTASAGYGISAFNSNGFSLGQDQYTVMNENNNTFASWTFRRAAKFFDVVTYTGDGVAGRQIAHGLGAQAGFVTVKATSTTGDWNSYHRSATGDLKLNLTDAQTASRAIITAADASTFTVSGAANTNGVSYVAYLWGHDPSAEGIIQCGSYAGNGSASGPEIDAGGETQSLIVKRATGGDADWLILDTMRGLDHSDNKFLRPNTSGAESSGAVFFTPTARGFKVATVSALVNNNGDTYIYLAIRRPNKPPTTGTQVYNAIARTGTQNVANITGVGFAPDLLMTHCRAALNFTAVWDKLRGVSETQERLLLTSSDAERTSSFGSSSGSVLAFGMDGVKVGIDSVNQVINYYNGSSGFINYFFRRAPRFFDVVCDTGTGVAHAIAHNLTKAPELIIRKSRSAATQWEVWHSALAATEKLVLNSNAAKAADATAWGSTLPTATQFTVGTGANVNANAATFVTYLFATLAGISKVGSYTGNGSSQTIDCGFSTGARFVLIKRTDATGDWYVWDTARGIVAANDPHLSLNTTAAEVTTDDSVDPEASGFIVNQNTATNINVNGGQYIFLAIA